MTNKNILSKKFNYTNTDTTTPNPYFREIISSVNPDIITVQEMTSQAGVDGLQQSSDK